jgi:hypothetical protein
METIVSGRTDAWKAEGIQMKTPKPNHQTPEKTQTPILKPARLGFGASLGFGDRSLGFFQVIS